MENPQRNKLYRAVLECIREGINELADDLLEEKPEKPEMREKERHFVTRHDIDWNYYVIDPKTDSARKVVYGRSIPIFAPSSRENSILIEQLVDQLNTIAEMNKEN